MAKTLCTALRTRLSIAKIQCGGVSWRLLAAVTCRTRSNTNHEYHGMCATEKSHALVMVTWLSHDWQLLQNVLPCDQIAITWLSHDFTALIWWSHDLTATTQCAVTWLDNDLMWLSHDIPQEGSGTQLCLLQSAAADHEQHPASADLQGSNQLTMTVHLSCFVLLKCILFVHISLSYLACPPSPRNSHVVSTQSLPQEWTVAGPIKQCF